MKIRKGVTIGVILLIAAVALVGGSLPAFAGKGVPPIVIGNCLSYPVIWAEGVEKVLRGYSDMDPVLKGIWWYQWGTNGVDPNIVPASCPPDPDETNTTLNDGKLPLCDDDISGSVNLSLEAGKPEADNPQTLARAYLQKDSYNIWQAESADWSDSQVDVDWIDWGDSIESMDWNTHSKVRLEVVLIKDLENPMRQYEMRHTSGWGIDEVHGLAARLGNNPTAYEISGQQATVYSHCARQTIQKLFVPRDDPRLADLVWTWDVYKDESDNPEPGWAELNESGVFVTPSELISNIVLFNGAVYEGEEEGSDYYSAETNVKGKIMYGYTWNVKNLHDDSDGYEAGEGYYRVTFSLDETCGGVTKNTDFDEEDTEILLPIEVETVSAESDYSESDSPPGGVAMIDYAKDLTYIDLNILPKMTRIGKE